MKRNTILFSVAVLLTVFPQVPAKALRVAYNPARQHDPATVWQQARAQQKKQGTLCIVVEFSTNLQHNQALGRALQAPNKELREILAATVIVCLRRDYMKQTFAGMKDNENMLLVNPDGKRIDGQTIDFVKTNTPGKFAAAARKLLFAEKGKHLKAAADAKDETLAVKRRTAILQALKDLDGAFKQRRAAKKLLAKELPDAMPFILITRYTTESIEVRESCKELLADYAAGHQLKANGVPNVRTPYRR